MILTAPTGKNLTTRSSRKGPYGPMRSNGVAEEDLTLAEIERNREANRAAVQATIAAILPALAPQE